MGRRKSIKSATKDYDLLEGLKALAARLAAECDACESPKELAGLARQYRETMIKIDELEGGEDDGDEIAAIILRNRKSDSD